jgi:hypothetical protein
MPKAYDPTTALAIALMDMIATAERVAKYPAEYTELAKAAALARDTLHGIAPTSIKVVTMTTDGDNMPIATEVFLSRAVAEAAANAALGTKGLTGDLLASAWEEKNGGALIIEEHVFQPAPLATATHIVLARKDGEGPRGFLTVRNGRVLLQTGDESVVALAVAAGDNAVKMRFDLERAATADECLAIVRAAISPELTADFV